MDSTDFIQKIDKLYGCLDYHDLLDKIEGDRTYAIEGREEHDKLREQCRAVVDDRSRALRERDAAKAEVDSIRKMLNNAEREIEALVDYLSDAWRDCDHEYGGAPGCPTCEERWSKEVRTAVSEHRDHLKSKDDGWRQIVDGVQHQTIKAWESDHRALEDVAKAIVEQAKPPLPDSVPLAVRLAWVVQWKGGKK